MPDETQHSRLIVELKNAISTSGLSYTELARRAGVSTSQVSRFMSDKSEMTITLITASKLFDYFGLKITLPELEKPAVDTESVRTRPSGKQK